MNTRLACIDEKLPRFEGNARLSAPIINTPLGAPRLHRMDPQDAHEPQLAHALSSPRVRMAHLEGVVTGPRAGRMRDRRGRGARGPLALPGPLSPQSVPAHVNPREDFDGLVSAILATLAKHFEAEPGRVEVVTEEAPLLPDGWTDAVPTSALVRGTSTDSGTARIVLYRLPLTKRCGSRREVEDSTWDVLLNRLAEVWEMSPDDIDPRG